MFFEDVELGDDIGPLEKIASDQDVIDFCNLWGPPSPNRFTDPDEAAKIEDAAQGVFDANDGFLVNRITTSQARRTGQLCLQTRLDCGMEGINLRHIVTE